MATGVILNMLVSDSLIWPVIFHWTMYFTQRPLVPCKRMMEKAQQELLWARKSQDSTFMVPCWPSKSICRDMWKHCKRSPSFLERGFCRKVGDSFPVYHDVIIELDLNWDKQIGEVQPLPELELERTTVHLSWEGGHTPVPDYLQSSHLPLLQ